jgi:DNA-binding CsgD family transcriptional regulator
MRYVEVNWSELGMEQEPDRSDNGKAKEQLDRKVDCQDILRQLPWPVLFSKLTKDEKTLARLFYFKQKSKSEIARILGKDDEEVDWDLNSLRNKIRSRAEVIVRGTPLEDALVKLGVLPAKQVAGKKPLLPLQRARRKKTDPQQRKNLAGREMKHRTHP